MSADRAGQLDVNEGDARREKGRVMAITRIPLTITATATGQTTDGVLVAVMVDELDKLEAHVAASPGAAMVAAERLRQIVVEGYTPEHDDELTGYEFVRAAIAYALLSCESPCAPDDNADARGWWPWSDASWKPKADRLHNLVRAGALIAAEVDRIVRDA